MNKENTRVLGIGEQVKSGDLVEFEGELIPVSEHDFGQIITGDELFDVRRPTIPSAIDLIAAEYDIVTDMGKAALVIALENVATLDRKQRDYGSGNILSFGEYGVLVRVWDKVSRLKNLLTNVQSPSNESIDDSWLDLSNYAIIAVMLRRKLWK